MKIILVILLALCATGICNDFTSSFGLVGPTTITEAEVWTDGGSVSMTLRDAHGTTRRVYYRNNWLNTDREHGGQLSIRSPDAKPNWLPKNGTSEQALLAVVRAASVTTFGTADWQKLRKASGATTPVQESNPPAISDMLIPSLDFRRFATSSLFQQIASRDKAEAKRKKSN